MKDVVNMRAPQHLRRRIVICRIRKWCLELSCYSKVRSSYMCDGHV